MGEGIRVRAPSASLGGRQIHTLEKTVKHLASGMMKERNDTDKFLARLGKIVDVRLCDRI